MDFASTPQNLSKFRIAATFQLFLTAARHYAIAIGHSSTADNIQRYVMNSDPHLMEDPGIEVFKIWPAEANREMFKSIVSSKDRVNYTRNITNTGTKNGIEYIHTSTYPNCWALMAIFTTI